MLQIGGHAVECLGAEADIDAARVERIRLGDGRTIAVDVLVIGVGVAGLRLLRPLWSKRTPSTRQRPMRAAA